ncbi:MAG TPA: MBL fold metallo-hydrolase [Chloroflexi bacterium]|nr:MBL fold metallo-hydrolase [Chloroflexota bacterium]
MLRERVSDDIYVFTSALYAKVTAGAVVTGEGMILIDSLPFPDETKQMRAFLTRVSRPGVRYVVLTHYHADHTYGAYLFPQADIVARERCMELLIKVGIPTLERVKEEDPALEEVTIRLPDVTFDEGEMGLRLGEKVVRLIQSPGHTPDSLMAYVEDDRVLFAADTVLPVPSIVDGEMSSLRASLRKILDLSVENMVQGHGEVILRGEVDDIVKISLNYLDAIEEKVDEALKREDGREKLAQDNIESTGLSRLPLNGLVQQIHVANLLSLYERRAS